MAALRARTAGALLLLAAGVAAVDDAQSCGGEDFGAVAECMEEKPHLKGALLLQVKHERGRKSRMLTSGADFCNVDAPEFNARRCHELHLGVSEPSALLEPAEEPTGMGLLTGDVSSCAKTFHALSLDEAEKLQPGLKSCLVSTWAAKMHQTLAKAPCAQGDMKRADVVVLPGYTAVECNWPIYGGGDCMNRRDSLVNFARAGSRCRGDDTLQAFRNIQSAIGKQVVVLENSPNPHGHKYDLPDDSVYAEPSLSWAFVGADSAHYRLGTDISVPPGPSLRCQMSEPTSQSAKSFAQPLKKKAFLASFKGGFNMHPFRQTARAALHDGRQIIIADTSDDAWDFDHLLFSSVFALILRGDAIMTTRINEAVCSGGIPVLVTDSWIPPFNETVPFTNFGLIHDEANVETLKKRLEGISSKKRDKLRKEAQKACGANFQTIEAHGVSLAKAISGISKLGPAEASA